MKENENGIENENANENDKPNPTINFQFNSKFLTDKPNKNKLDEEAKAFLIVPDKEEIEHEKDDQKNPIEEEKDDTNGKTHKKGKKKHKLLKENLTSVEESKENRTGMNESSFTAFIKSFQAGNTINCIINILSSSNLFVIFLIPNVVRLGGLWGTIPLFVIACIISYYSHTILAELRVSLIFNNFHDLLINTRKHKYVVLYYNIYCFYTIGLILINIYVSYIFFTHSFFINLLSNPIIEKESSQFYNIYYLVVSFLVQLCFIFVTNTQEIIQMKDELKRIEQLLTPNVSAINISYNTTDENEDKKKEPLVSTSKIAKKEQTIIQEQKNANVRKCSIMRIINTFLLIILFCFLIVLAVIILINGPDLVGNILNPQEWKGIFLIYPIFALAFSFQINITPEFTYLHNFASKTSKTFVFTIIAYQLIMVLFFGFTGSVSNSIPGLVWIVAKRPDNSDLIEITFKTIYLFFGIVFAVKASFIMSNFINTYTDRKNWGMSCVTESKKMLLNFVGLLVLNGLWMGLFSFIKITILLRVIVSFIAVLGGVIISIIQCIPLWIYYKDTLPLVESPHENYRGKFKILFALSGILGSITTIGSLFINQNLAEWVNKVTTN